VHGEFLYSEGVAQRGAPAAAPAADRDLLACAAWLDISSRAKSHAAFCSGAEGEAAQNLAALEGEVAALEARVRREGAHSQLRRKDAAAARLAEFKNRLHTAHFLVALGRAMEQDKRRARAAAAAAAAAPPPPGAPAPPAPIKATGAASYREDRDFALLVNMKELVRRTRVETEARAEKAKLLWEEWAAQPPPSESVIDKVRGDLEKAKEARERAAEALRERIAAALRSRSPSSHYA